jgi:hypothetical protein
MTCFSGLFALIRSLVISQCFQALAHLKALSLWGVLIEDACQEHSAIRIIVYACRLSSIDCGFLEILAMARSASLTSDATCSRTRLIFLGVVVFRVLSLTGISEKHVASFCCNVILQILVSPSNGSFSHLATTMPSYAHNLSREACRSLPAEIICYIMSFCFRISKIRASSLRSLRSLERHQSSQRLKDVDLSVRCWCLWERGT